MLMYMTAGESHGMGLTAILEGMVSGLSLSRDDINTDLARRQRGFGRGGRMAIEKDTVEIVSGVRHGTTIGAPISLFIPNRDYRAGDAGPAMTGPRPGHADLAGALKFNVYDLRDILERASARETAARVAVGAVCKKFLDECGVRIVSWVTSIGDVNAGPVREPGRAFAAAEESDLRCHNKTSEKKMTVRIREAMKRGDSLGGVFEVVALGVPPGLGSYAQWDRRLDGRLALALMSIQAVKAVEIGDGIAAAGRFGSQVHDEIFYSQGKFRRRTNRAGGLEGGVTNGEALVLRSYMKPISTLGRPLRSVDIVTKKPVKAQVVRTDVCAVPAASVIGEAQVAFVLAQSFLEKFGGDSLGETLRNFRSYTATVKRF